MAIKQYILKTDGAKQLSPAFRVREFRCRDGTDTILIDEGLVVLLQCIREHFGKPVTITSGYRTASHNAKVGGSRSSQHLLGRAADIQVQDTDPLAVAAYAESLMPGWGGVGRYPVKAGRAKGWVHVDTRPNKSRWTLCGGESSGKHHLSHPCRCGDPNRRADRQQPQSGCDRHQAGRADPRGAGAQQFCPPRPHFGRADEGGQPPHR